MNLVPTGMDERLILCEKDYRKLQTTINIL